MYNEQNQFPDDFDKFVVKSEIATTFKIVGIVGLALSILLAIFVLVVKMSESDRYTDTPLLAAPIVIIMSGLANLAFCMAVSHTLLYLRKIAVINYEILKKK
ncbi:MAG: hypothetical protein ACRCXN_12935 [Bacteroidales bacterium]